jgi:hypothetical protein
MKAKLQIALISASLIVPAVASAQATGASASGQTQAQAQTRTPKARIDAAMQAAARANVPLSLLESKVAEGEAKQVPQERIATAVETRLQVLVRAVHSLEQAGLQATSAANLAVAADALQAGVSEEALVKVSRSASPERRVVAVAVLADLVRLGQSSEPALSRVTAALSSSAALANLHAEVASQLRLGGLSSTLDAAGLVRIR